jgi:hypothetical protein
MFDIGRQHITNGMVADILRNKSDYYFRARKFHVLSVSPTYSNIAIFSKGLSVLFILWPVTAIRWRNMNIRLVFSALTSVLTYLLVTNIVFAFLSKVGCSFFRPVKYNQCRPEAVSAFNFNWNWYRSRIPIPTSLYTWSVSTTNIKRLTLFWKITATNYENKNEHKYTVWEKFKDSECCTHCCHYVWRNSVYS